MLPGTGLSSLRLLFGRAFLAALERRDRENALVFARALLTQFPATASHRV